MDRPAFSDGVVVFIEGTDRRSRRRADAGPRAPRCARRSTSATSIILPGPGQRAHAPGAEHLRRRRLAGGHSSTGSSACRAASAARRTSTPTSISPPRPARASSSACASASRRVGDISQQMHVTRPILATRRSARVSYGEVIGLGERRRASRSCCRGTRPSRASDRLRIGFRRTRRTRSIWTVSAMPRTSRERTASAGHAPGRDARRSASSSSATPARFARCGSAGQWATSVDDVPTAGRSRFAQAIGLLDYPTLLAHVNYCDDDELGPRARPSQRRLLPAHARYFGHPPHRWREMLAARDQRRGRHRQLRELAGPEPRRRPAAAARDRAGVSGRRALADGHDPRGAGDCDGTTRSAASRRASQPTSSLRRADRTTR